MSVVVVVTAFPLPEHRAEVVAAFEAAITRVHDEPGVELYALHQGPDRLVVIEKYESECLLARFGTDAAGPRLMGPFLAAAARRGRRPLRGGGGLAGDEDQFEAGTVRRAADIC